MTDKQLLEQLEKKIFKGYGKPCKERFPFCANCIAWEALNTLKQALDIYD